MTYGYEPGDGCPVCDVCHDTGIEETYGGHGDKREIPCRKCRQPTEDALIENAEGFLDAMGEEVK